MLRTRLHKLLRYPILLAQRIFDVCFYLQNDFFILDGGIIPWADALYASIEHRRTIKSGAKGVMHCFIGVCDITTLLLFNGLVRVEKENF